MAVEAKERPEAETVGSSPARRLSVTQREGLEQHFGPTDVRVDLLRLPVVGPLLDRAVRSRRFQFSAILPNQIVFWLVIVTGLVGAALPTRNFATVITWYVWFCVVFLLMVGVGRGWCVMCPFGGAGEWVQRLSFWQRHPISIGLHRKWPESWSRYGMLPSVGVFVAMTWAEEFLNIAGPGRPLFTGLMVIFIISFAVGTFLVFDRRTFCRYVCPLTALIGTVGSTGMVAGLRTRDREMCLRCPTKDCMRGSEKGYPCPWYEWPGSATSNNMCGLCTECIKNCPYDNVGIFVQSPLNSVIAPVRRRLDIAVAVLIFFGLVIFQQVNALGFYMPLDNRLNQITHFFGYPNPIAYVGVIALVSLLGVGYVWILRAVFARRDAQTAAGGRSGLSTWLAPLAYGLIPLMGVDYLARQLPKFWLDSPKLIAAISDPFGFGWNLFGTAHLGIAGAQILTPEGVVISQVVLVALGTAGAVYATFRIVRRDLAPLTRHPRSLGLVTAAAWLLSGAGVAALYVAMGAAT
ncbi:MAG TPA: 4Fe-4S binding protein [Candidatus Nitrosotalea sp.]|nr:4Fe-4S binding protein [Candidatus Nitrosotalea sp.]